MLTLPMASEKVNPGRGADLGQQSPNPGRSAKSARTLPGIDGLHATWADPSLTDCHVPPLLCRTSPNPCCWDGSWGT